MPRCRSIFHSMLVRCLGEKQNSTKEWRLLNPFSAYWNEQFYGHIEDMGEQIWPWRAPFAWEETEGKKCEQPFSISHHIHALLLQHLDDSLCPGARSNALFASWNPLIISVDVGAFRQDESYYQY